MNESLITEYKNISKKLSDEIDRISINFNLHFLETIFLNKINNEVEEEFAFLNKFQKHLIFKLSLETKKNLKLFPLFNDLNKLFDFYEQSNQNEVKYVGYNYENNTLIHKECNELLKNPFFEKVFCPRFNNRDFLISLYNNSERINSNSGIIYSLKIDKNVLLKIKKDFLISKSENLQILENLFFSLNLKEKQHNKKIKL